MKHLLLLLLVSEISYGQIKVAQKAFAEKDYSKAALSYYQVFKNKKTPDLLVAEAGLADSLFAMGLFYSSSKYYSHLIQLGATNNASYFRAAMEKLGAIDYDISLGQSHVVQLFKLNIDPASVPGAARGFFFYYKGIESFAANSYKTALSYFERVNPTSSYFLKAQFYKGVIENISGDSAKAMATFQRIISQSDQVSNGKWLKEQSHMNLARILYEQKNYAESIKYYALIPRESDNWLEALFEASWAFFLMEKANNALGNIHTLHSPFFEQRFFPESYILQSITFLRLCRFDRAKESMALFKKKYTPVLNEMKSLLEKNEKNQPGFFSYVMNYKTGDLKEFRNAWIILDALTRTDSFKQARQTITNSNRELSKLERMPENWQNSGLMDELKSYLGKKSLVASKDSGRRLYRDTVSYYTYLLDLFDQTKLITAELLLGKVEELKSELNISTEKRKENFIGGMQPLVVGEKLEYWPFEGEYWEDELGGYVFNIDSKCQ